MAATAQDFSMYEGETRPVQITIQDEAGDPVDVTGWTIQWTLNTSTPVTKSTTAGTLVINDGPNGVIAFTLQPADTAGVGTVTKRHECKARGPAGQYVVTVGTATVSDSLHGVLA